MISRQSNIFYFNNDSEQSLELLKLQISCFLDDLFQLNVVGKVSIDFEFRSKESVDYV